MLLPKKLTLVSGGHHRLMQDDIQDGYLIPGGTAVIVNIWLVTTVVLSL